MGKCSVLPGDWFNDIVRQKVGNDGRTSFWEHMWVGDTSLRHIFPRLFTLSEKKECCTYLKLYLSFCLFNFWQSITFDRYSIEEGIDHYGFNTSMVTTNSSLKLTFTNTATFSGIHVTSIPLEMKNYNQLPIATGNVSINLFICFLFERQIYNFIHPKKKFNVILFKP